MLDAITFQNFKVLRKATLPLSPFTLIVGPNGSGKSTALQAFLVVKERALREQEGRPVSWKDFEKFITAGLEVTGRTSVEIILHWSERYDKGVTTAPWRRDRKEFLHHARSSSGRRSSEFSEHLASSLLSGIRVYSLDASAITQPVNLEPAAELSPNGRNLVGVMDSLRDKDPERFEALNNELGRWLPEFDRILFETPEIPDSEPSYYAPGKASMRYRLETCPRGRCWLWPFSLWRTFPIYPH